ncbi:hypothetical protein M011DRAFT_457046 [Sporormia fimetaria CBS 119925]|uniref:Uncharacterized protein n=1 Tax=Sporormia fimetaria CBS 119925 TaxID=1340428 RepID=A0A6A6VI83_9PLEO|nr:hypothetical protein M011DRAFT_457046 [Sporormia fimetaria CBS 119925]
MSSYDVVLRFSCLPAEIEQQIGARFGPSGTPLPHIHIGPFPTRNEALRHVDTIRWRMDALGVLRIEQEAPILRTDHIVGEFYPNQNPPRGRLLDPFPQKSEHFSQTADDALDDLFCDNPQRRNFPSGWSWSSWKPCPNVNLPPADFDRRGPIRKLVLYEDYMRQHRLNPETELVIIRGLHLPEEGLEWATTKPPIFRRRDESPSLEPAPEFIGYVTSADDARRRLTGWVPLEVVTPEEDARRDVE